MRNRSSDPWLIAIVAILIVTVLFVICCFVIITNATGIVFVWVSKL